jgi:signal transduction histidine kinase/ActR/RegA family two-component response regulator
MGFPPLSAPPPVEALQALQYHDRALERNQRALRELATMEYGNLQHAMEHAAERLADTLATARASVWLYNAGRTEMRCRALVHDGQLVSEQIALTQAAYPRYFLALRAERTIAAEHARTDPRTAEFADGYLAPLGIWSMLDTSIVIAGEPVGVVCIEHTGEPRAWTLEDQDLAASAASLLAVSVSLDRQRVLERQLQQSQKMEAMGLLAGGVAHDFNNILSVILGETDLALDALDDREATRGSLSVIAESAQRAAGITRRLLSFSKKQAAAPQPVDVGALVVEFETMLGRGVGETVSLSVNRPPAPLVVDGDRTLIEQVLLNLAVNARQAMPTGGRLTVDVAPVVVDATTAEQVGRPAGEYARLAVRDTGVGMSPAVLARIWEPFFTTRDTGTGLGLAIVHGAARQLGGFLTVNSELGVGTEFALHVPLRAALGAAPGATRSTLRARTAHGRLLLAEDDPDVRRTLAVTLRRVGFEVAEATNGEDAVSLMRDTPHGFDLLIIDIAMPRLDGPGAFGAIRRLRPDLGVLFLSGYGEETGMISDIIRGDTAVRLLAKPAPRDDLLFHVYELLDHTKQHER